MYPISDVITGLEPRTPCSVICTSLIATSPLPQHFLLYCKIYVSSYRGWKSDKIIWITWSYIQNVYRIRNEFSFHTVFMKRVVCFCFSEPLAIGKKNALSVHFLSFRSAFHSAATGINIKVHCNVILLNPRKTQEFVKTQDILDNFFLFGHTKIKKTRKAVVINFNRFLDRHRN